MLIFKKTEQDINNLNEDTKPLIVLGHKHTGNTGMGMAASWVWLEECLSGLRKVLSRRHLKAVRHLSVSPRLEVAHLFFSQSLLTKIRLNGPVLIQRLEIEFMFGPHF